MNYSVIIPTYNSAAFISRAIHSCLTQTWTPKEIIIINDASTDNTEKIVEPFLSFPNIKYYSHEKNEGVAAARNKGWDMATSDWIAFLDSDDEWHPNKMEWCKPFLIEEKTKLLCHLFQYESWNEKAIKDTEKRVTPISFLRTILRNPTTTCSLIVSNTINLRYDKSMRYCEDHDFIIRARYYNKLSRVELPLARVHRKKNSKGGLSGSLWKMRKGEIYAYLKLPKLNILFIPLIPILITISLLKHSILLTRKGLGL